MCMTEIDSIDAVHLYIVSMCFLCKLLVCIHPALRCASLYLIYI
jgi:hypothetical protein